MTTASRKRIGEKIPRSRPVCQQEISILNPQAAGSVTGARLGRSARALSPRGYLRKVRGARSLRPWRVEFTLCPATLPLPGEAADLGLSPASGGLSEDGPYGLGGPENVVVGREPVRHGDAHGGHPFQTLPPAQQVPSSCTCAVTLRVKASLSDPGQENLTRTWFSTTSLRMVTMGSSDRSNAMSRACRQFRSTISRTPFLPRLFRPQYRGKPGLSLRTRGPTGKDPAPLPPRRYSTGRSAPWKPCGRRCVSPPRSRVVGDVQPLVGVRGPGIGEFNAVRMGFEGRQHSSPRPKAPST